MCVIVDADVSHKVFADPTMSEYLPLLKWIISGSGRLVVGGTNLQELWPFERARRLIEEWIRTGKAVRLTDDQLESEKGDWQALVKSNDVHVIALARASGARLLCTGDLILERDFKNTALIDRPPGKLYKIAKTHRRLLGHSGSCGIDATGVWKK